jgi:type IV pilus assembly protein PilX
MKIASKMAGSGLLAGRGLRATRAGLARRERGVTLVIALMFMVALTLLGVGMVRSTTSEERMGANSRDYDVAFAAAEAALRDAEIRIQGVYTNPSAPLSFTSFPTSSGCGSTGAQRGLCYGLTEQAFINQNLNVAPSAPLGYVDGSATTGTSAITGVNTAPNYLIEIIQIQNIGGSAPLIAYRITSRGFGRRDTTQVQLQEVVVY